MPQATITTTTKTINQNLLNQLDSVEVVSQINVPSQSPSTASKVNSPRDSKQNVSNTPITSKTINSSLTTFANGSQMIDLKLTEGNNEFIKSDSVLMSIDQNDNINASISAEIQPTDTSSRIDNNQNNLSNLTSDSNNTNNMTTSDVNLSDTMENPNDPL